MQSTPDPKSPESEFRLLADNAPVLIWRSGPDRLCDWFNQPWLEFTGRSLEQEIGNGWADGVHPDDAERCLNIYRSAFDRREPFAMEYRLRRRDGAYRWLLDHGRPYWREGTFAGYFGSCIDVSEHRETEQRLHEAIEERETLVRELHHRVRNNLQILTSLIRILANGTGEDATLRSLDSRIHAMAAVQQVLHQLETLTHASVRSFLGLVLPALSVAHPGAHIRLEPGPFDFRLAINDAANFGLAISEAIGLLSGAEDAEIAVELKTVEGSPGVVLRTRSSASQNRARERQTCARLLAAYGRSADFDVRVKDAGTTRAVDLRLN